MTCAPRQGLSSEPFRSEFDLPRATPSARPREGTTASESRLEQLRTAPASELRALQPPQTTEQLLREWHLLVSMRVRSLQSAALAQLRRSSPPLESEATLDHAVELAIGAGHFTWIGSPYTTRALDSLRRNVRCSYQQLRESLDRLLIARRIKQEQLSDGDSDVLFVWKRECTAAPPVEVTP